MINKQNLPLNLQPPQQPSQNQSFPIYANIKPTVDVNVPQTQQLSNSAILPTKKQQSKDVLNLY